MTWTFFAPPRIFPAALLAFLLLQGSGAAMASRPQLDDRLPGSPQSQSQSENSPVSVAQAIRPADADNSHAEEMLIASGVLLVIAFALLIFAARRALGKATQPLRRGSVAPIDEKGWLGQSEQLFPRLMENASDPIFRYDRDCCCRYANQAAIQFARQPLAKLIGSTSAEGAPFAPEQGMRLTEAIRGVFASGKGDELQLAMLTPEDEQRSYQLFLIPESHPHDQTASVLVMVREVAELRRTDARHAHFFDVVPGLFYTLIRRVNGSYVMSFANAGARDLYGLEPETVMQDFSKLLAVIHPDDAEMRRQKLEESARDLTPFRIEYRIIHPQKGLRWLEVHSLPQRLADGGTRWDGLVHDITEHKHMEAEMRRREETLRTLLDNFPYFVWLKDKDSRLLAANQQYARVAKVTCVSELEGKTDFDFFPPDLAEKYVADDRSVMAGGVVKNIEEMYADENGERHWMETWKSPVIVDGQVVGTVGCSRDITERKKLDELTRQRQQEFRALAENSPDIIMRYDRECRRIYVNPAFVKQVGKPAEELLGGTPTEYSSLPQAVLYQDALRWAIESGAEVKHEYTWPTVSGRIVVSDFRIVPERDANGQIASLLAIGRDITERKAMEDALHDNLRFTRELIEAIPGPVFFKDADGFYLGCNAAFERYYGIPRDNLIGKGVFDLWPRDLAERYHAADRQLIENPGTQIYEAQMQAPEGRRDVVFHKATFARADGSIGGQIGVILDITERKGAEQYEKFRTRSLELLSSSATLPTILEGIVLGIEQLNPGALCSILLLDSEGKHLVDGIAPSLPDFYNATANGLAIGMGVGSCGEAAFTGQRVITEDIKTHPNWAIGRKIASRAGLGACWSEPIRSASGEVLGTFAIYHREPYSPTESDLSLIEKTAHLASIAIERKRAEVELQRRELEFRSLVENTPDIISRYDRDCRRLFGNAAFYTRLKTSTSALGKRPSECPGGESGTIVEAKINQVFATGQNTDFELHWSDRDDNQCCSHFRLTAERDASGSIISVLSVGHDITELSLSRQKIHQMAFYDTLTKLPNRALFNDRLHQMLIEAARHGQQAGVMLLDLDRFKVVNDTLGHPAGDQLLREAGARLSSCLRDYDTVARLGGDEFAILLPEIRSGDDMGKIASNILDVFKAPFMLEGQEAFISTSIGIAAYPGDSLDADELIKQADSAMYSAKRSGRNAFCFYSKDLTDSANERLTLEADLRHGFERGELELYYQPKVCLATGMVLGSEALLRWHHPARGMVAPDRFIPIAEDSGQIIEIGAWVLREACRTANEWNAPGKPLHKVAINLSARQFQIGNLLQTVRKALDETNCRTEWIELEITESMLLDEDGKVLEILETLRTMGITIAIDDFGTGYSSLSYLARFPIDTLKIDRSFTSRVVQSEDHAELVKAMISIAQNLKQNVVAEGVETEAEAAFLREHGCHVGQGYLYSKPVPKSVFESLSFADRLHEVTN